MHQAGLYADAENTLLPALLVGLEQGMVRTFLDEGNAVISIIERLCERDRQHQLPAQTSPDFGRWLNNLLAANKAQSENDDKAVPTAESINNTQHLLTPLKAREVDILKLLENGLSNKEIARQLNIGINTVKWYLKSTYSKLGVTKRAQAVTEARRLKILTGCALVQPSLFCLSIIRE